MSSVERAWVSARIAAAIKAALEIERAGMDAYIAKAIEAARKEELERFARMFEDLAKSKYTGQPSWFVLLAHRIRSGE